jgi:hypothetical protein
MRRKFQDFLLEFERLKNFKIWAIWGNFRNWETLEELVFFLYFENAGVNFV